MNKLIFDIDVMGKVVIKNRKYFKFDKNTYVTTNQIKKVYDFARGMTFEGIGKHRQNRSGGTIKRTVYEIFIDAFQGKLSEYALYNYFKAKGVTSNVPDLEQAPLGIWDKYDIRIGNKLISVKSTKGQGSLLLLETKDYDSYGRYISTEDGIPENYDYFCFVRMVVSKDYVQDEIVFNNFEKFMEKQFFKFQITGFLDRKVLSESIIGGDMVVRKGYYLNETVKMDADNYYCQACDLIEPDYFCQNELNIK